MLGEIIKSTEALRYHAKTAEIAGQNLAHVNDESYARQRVLSREGLMSKGQGGLNTTSIETAGLDHARNELLDKRVFSEFAESANLETQKEILSLLEAALGESIDRQQIGGTLNGDNDSNLAAGGLARSIDDLFNAFQELSASPDEATAKEEIINKIKTLTKRFNDAGNAIDEIDSDISSSVEGAVVSVNRLLDQLYDVNLQIKRFELLGQGKAVTYRDNRQGLLEDLSKLLNFKIDPEVDDGTGRETGFWNLSAIDHQNQQVDLLNSTKGVSYISKDFGKIVKLDNPAGTGAQVRAKIGADGKLGHVEVLDGGSQYDDADGPILFSLAPPIIGSEVDDQANVATSAHQSGSLFSQAGKLYQSLRDTLAGADLTDEDSFLEISNLPINGQVFPESLRRYSDLESFEKGDQVYYEGKLYQAVDSVGATSTLKLGTSNELLRKLSKGEVVNYDGRFFQVLGNKDAGTQISPFDLTDAKVGEEVDGILALGDSPPQKIEELSYVPSVVDGNRPDRWFLTQSYQAGDYVKVSDKFFQFTKDSLRGQEVDQFARAMQALTYDQTKNYAAGDFVELDGLYYEFVGGVNAFADPNTIVENLSEAIGSETLPFDGLLKAVEDPNWHFIESNGAYKISDAFREYELSGLSGSEQTQQVRISGLSGGESDIFNFDISINGVKVVMTEAETGEVASDTETNGSFSLTGFSQDSFSGNLKDKILEIESTGSAVNGVPAADPAFEVLVDESTGDLLISAVSGLGEFDFAITTTSTEPGGDVTENGEPQFTLTQERDYFADKYNLVFSSETFDDVPISVAFQGSADETAQAITKAISENETLSQSISTIVSNGDIIFRAKDEDFDFSVKMADVDGVEDLHNELTNQTKISTTNQSEPTSELINEAFEGVPVSISLNNFSGLEVVQKTEIIFPGQFGEATGGIDYGDQISLNLDLAGNTITIEIPESPGRTLEELISQTEETLLSIERDGTFQEGVQATDPAFTLENRFGEATGVVTTWRNDRAGEIWVSGVPGLGKFDLSAISDNASVKLLEDYSLNDYNLFIEGENGDLGSITIPFQGNEADTVEAIKEAINNDDVLNKEVIAVAQGTELTVTGLNPESDFTNIRWDPNASVFEPTPTTFNLNPILPTNQTDQISNLSGLEQVKNTSIQFNPGQFDEQTIPFSIIVNDITIDLELPAGNEALDPARFETLLTKIQSINKDGSITADDSISKDPAFSVNYLQDSFTFLLTGNPGTRDFQVAADEANGILTTIGQPYLSDDFTIQITDENGAEIGAVLVPSTSDASENALAIVNAINQDVILSQSVLARRSADGTQVLVEGLNPTILFNTNISVDDKLNEFTVSEVAPIEQSEVASLQNSGPQIARVEINGIDSIGIVSSKAQSLEFKKGEEPMSFKQNEIFYFQNELGEFKHFMVTAPTEEIDPGTFDPLDPTWENNFKFFNPQLLDESDPAIIVRKAFTSGHNLDNGSLVELNLGLAEAVVKKGEITGFNIISGGNGLPGTDSIFADGKELLVDSGAIKGYQDSRSVHLEKFRTDLNDLVSSFVENINSIYNPEDEPGAYVFGFDAVLTRPLSGRNLLMEEEYGYYGREGEASITLYRDEVEMTLPSTENETFTLVNTTPIFPEDFAGETFYYRGGDNAETIFRADDAGDLVSFYASASKMQNVTIENQEAYPGSDSIPGTEDDGRSLMMAYETIPFRVEGLEEGSKLPIIGDNFTFSALLSNPWNLATSLKADQDFTSESLQAGSAGLSGSNNIALAIAEMGEGGYLEKVALLNANLGNTISDISDNLDHQQSVEKLLLDQRRAVSSVSIDEEVADLMRFQRSFQASSRVLSTLDKMLEIVVMGLVR